MTEHTGRFTLGRKLILQRHFYDQWIQAKVVSPVNERGEIEVAVDLGSANVAQLPYFGVYTVPVTAEAKAHWQRVAKRYPKQCIPRVRIPHNESI